MPYPTCQHIKTNGVLCGSPALHRKTYCYYHQRLIGRHPPRRQDIIPGKTLALDRIGNRLDLLMNISMVVNAIATNQVDIKRGCTLIKGLQVASRNLSVIERLAKLEQDLIARSHPGQQTVMPRKRPARAAVAVPTRIKPVSSVQAAPSHHQEEDCRTSTSIKC